MIVRLRLKRSPGQLFSPAKRPLAPPSQPEIITWQEMAGSAATLLPPASALCFALTLWRLGQDMGFARNFFITQGTFSHWQVWLCLAASFLAAAQWLNRRFTQDSAAPAPPTPATDPEVWPFLRTTQNVTMIDTHDARTLVAFRRRAG